MHVVLSDALEHLGHVTQVVGRAGGVEQLVDEKFIRFVPDGEAKLGDDDGLLEGVPEMREVAAEVGRGDVHIGLGAVANVPAEGGECGLVDAVGKVGVGCVGCASGDAIAGGHHDGRGVRIDAEPVGGAVDVGDVLGCEGDVIGNCHLVGLGVVDS